MKLSKAEAKHHLDLCPVQPLARRDRADWPLCGRIQIGFYIANLHVDPENQAHGYSVHRALPNLE